MENDSSDQVSERDQILKLVRENSIYYSTLDIKWKNDRGILMEAIESSCWAIQFSPPQFRRDVELALFTISRSFYTISYFPEMIERSFWVRVDPKDISQFIIQ